MSDIGFIEELNGLMFDAMHLEWYLNVKRLKTDRLICEFCFFFQIALCACSRSKLKVVTDHWCHWSSRALCCPRLIRGRAHTNNYIIICIYIYMNVYTRDVIIYTTRTWDGNKRIQSVGTGFEKRPVIYYLSFSIQLANNSRSSSPSTYFSHLSATARRPADQSRGLCWLFQSLEVVYIV